MANMDSSDDEVIIPEDTEMDAGNPGLANAMKKVLAIGKKSEQKSTLVLAKAKVITATRTEEKCDKGFVVVRNNDENAEVSSGETDEDDVKPDKALIKRKRIRKQEVAAHGRLKPCPTDREQERPLMKIATRGVVQLFNAVREQQKIIEKKLGDAGPLHSKKEKAMKSINNKAFLDVLRGCSEPDKKSTVKDEDTNGTEPSWDVLRDDFMMGAKPKDWDKTAIEDDGDGQTNSKKPKHKK